jgi:hypothetical protein
LELLDQDGRLTSLPLNEVKMVLFVRGFADFDAESRTNDGPDRLLRRTFTSRPRTEGLWVRMTFRDSDVMEGVAANDLSLLDAQGVQVTPPDMRSNTQRIYVPRLALTELVVLGVISAPGTSGRHKKAAAAEEGSLDLFSELPPNTRPN